MYRRSAGLGGNEVLDTHNTECAACERKYSTAALNIYDLRIHFVEMISLSREFCRTRLFVWFFVSLWNGNLSIITINFE